jgi:hypothetical protein
MINARIKIKVKSLKLMLSLLNPDAEISKLTLGDTWYPSTGFADESILKHEKTIQQILEFPYDFRGLVQFEATIEEVVIKYCETDHEGFINFECIGAKHSIRKITDKIIELNAFFPDTYTILTQEVCN